MTRGEVLYAKRIVRDMHPLMRQNLEVVFPALEIPILFWKKIFGGKPPKTDEETQALAAGVPRSDAADEDTLSEGQDDFDLEEGEDPLTRLGYGIVSYFTLIRIFMYVFGLLSLVYLPSMRDFSSWGALAALGNTAYTVGNMGGAVTRCVSFRMTTDKVSLGCDTGFIGNVTDFGVYQHNSEADIMEMCSIDAGFNTGSNCKGYSSRESELYIDKLAPCQGKKLCNFKNLDEAIPIGTSYPDGEECKLSENDTLFVQYSCIVSNEELGLKRHQCLKACCISIFSTLFLFGVLNYMARNMSIEKNEWDLQTVTASDYCVELKITEEMVTNMKNTIRQRNYRPDLPMGSRMKFIFIEEIEKVMKDIGKQDGFHVADVNFAYRNSWLIDMLKVRGTAIKWQDWKKLN